MRSLVLLCLCLVSGLCRGENFAPVLPDFIQPAAQTRLDRHAFALLSASGWYPVHVPARGGQPAFSYSVGFYAYFARPEVVITGMPPAVAEQFLANLAKQVEATGAEFEMYTAYDGIAEDTQVAFRPVAPRYWPGHFDYAAWFYRSLHQPVPFLQMVWPDEGGRFPWDKGYDRAYLDAQPSLGE